VKLKSSGSVIASYRYDALGRRVEKNVGGTVERHILSIWNDPGVVGDLSHVVSVYDGSDVWRQNFVWSDEVDGIQMLEQKDVLDFDTDGNTTEVTRSFYHRNALGSVMEVTDMNQAAVVSYRYDPYGKATITRLGVPQASDPLGNHWTFTGRFLDEESGLLYYRARNNDPTTGRFLQRDPLGYAAGPALYTYARSLPTHLRDPSGLQEGSNFDLYDRPIEVAGGGGPGGAQVAWRTTDEVAAVQRAATAAGITYEVAGWAEVFFDERYYGNVVIDRIEPCKCTKGLSHLVAEADGTITCRYNYTCECVAEITLPEKASVRITTPYPNNQEHWGAVDLGQWDRFVDQLFEHEMEHARKFGNMWEKDKRAGQKITVVGTGGPDPDETVAKGKARQDREVEIRKALRAIADPMHAAELGRDRRNEVGNIHMAWPGTQGK
jgi:RHS repeat-associated protein